ncbi:hypothetical protein SAMN04488107_2958, partial [Geodermatophilus saharensis]
RREAEAQAAREAQAREAEQVRREAEAQAAREARSLVHAGAGPSADLTTRGRPGGAIRLAVKNPAFVIPMGLSVVPLALWPFYPYLSGYNGIHGGYATWWILTVAVPISVGTVLLGVRRDLWRNREIACGLLLAVGNIVTNSVIMQSLYSLSPGWWVLLLGWGIVIALGLMVIAQLAQGAKVVFERRRIVCGVIVGASASASIVVAQYAHRVNDLKEWFYWNSGTVLLVVLALLLTLLRLDDVQRLVGLVALGWVAIAMISLSVLLLIYGSAPSPYCAALAGVALLTSAACFEAQADRGKGLVRSGPRHLS